MLDVQSAKRSLLFVHQWGTGSQPCMLIHGFGDGAYVWADFARHLPADYRAYAVDLRGHGRSPRSPDGKYLTHVHAADVIESLDSLGLDRVVLIGHSLGGEVAMRVAIAQPERVRALVVVDFALGASRALGSRIIKDLSGSMRVYATVDEYLLQLTRLRPMVSMELLRHCATEALEGSAETGFRLRVDPAMYSLAHIPSKNPKLGWEMLTRITCPTLMLRGASSSVLPRAVAEKMAAAVPDCTLQEIEKSGHSIMLENPASFRERVKAFLHELEGRVPRADGERQLPHG